MRVAREFHNPDVAYRLETVREDALKVFLETAPEDPEAVKLREWQIREIEAGLEEAETEKGIPHEDIKEWVESWGTETELPLPKRG